MALFQKREERSNIFMIARQEPTISSDEGFVHIIIGLGNHGKEFEATRHNAGFISVDTYREGNNLPAWQEKSKFKAFISEDFVNGKKVILVKPTTFYNLSGESVRTIKEFYKVENKDITVIHDELDLSFGTVREKIGGSSAGNNGLKSIISLIGADFRRIRIGIKSDLLEKMDPADFVLAKFSSAEKKQLVTVIQTAIEKI